MTQPTAPAGGEREALIEPTEAEVSRAAWAWRNDKDRETDGSDDAYFRNYWRSLPGLRAYVTAQIELGRPLAEALVSLPSLGGKGSGSASPQSDTIEPRQEAIDGAGFTPGPWVAEKGGRGVQGATGEWAALACGDTDANADANACLIAAAPDLLAELKWCFIGAGNMERMAAAIAKAEGRS